MPNWVYNNITFSGDADKVQALKKQVGATTQIPGFEYVRDSSGNLELLTTGERATKLTVHTEENPVFSFWNIVQPTTPEELETYHDQGWYDWNIENWGTKWNASDPEVLEEQSGLWNVYFATAWSAPHEVLVKLSEQHPEVSIRNEWREEQGYGAHQVYSEGTHWLDKEWNVPESHEDYVENVGEDDCPCISYGLEESQYPYEDCPREALTTKQAVAELEKVSELI